MAICPLICRRFTSLDSMAAGQADEHERTMAFAEIALGQIKALRQPASPRNYDIWYAYATGYQPSLDQRINETLKQNGTLSEADFEQIYETHRFHRAHHHHYCLF
jgi:hypothetical protein